MCLSKLKNKLRTEAKIIPQINPEEQWNPLIQWKKMII